MESIDTRKTKLMTWLMKDCQLSVTTIQPLAGDASFRRYYRLMTPEQTFIAMDAPPPETCQPFVAISKALRHLALQTPQVYAADLESGFLLLSDFGNETYLRVLNAQNADQLYGQALLALRTLQSCIDVPGREIPLFTSDFMQQEWAWHKEWFTQKFLGIALSPQDQQQLDACYTLVVEAACAQPQVFMHRDYHSANLMRLPVSEQVGILDFQDAFIGPITYDLVSLLRDCYISWPEAKVQQWVEEYYLLLKAQKMINVAAAEFLRWFDWMGVQRQLKALLTFARKQVRDQQPQYLQHIPRTMQNLLVVSADYPELRPLQHYLQDIVQPVLAKENLLCAQ